MSPRSPFAHWSAVSLTGSSSGHVIALDQSGARKSPKRAQFTTSLKCNLQILNAFHAVNLSTSYKLTVD